MRTRSQTRRINGATVIQNAWRCTVSKCPITLSSIRPGRAIKVAGHLYDVYALGHYIANTGDYRDPLSRTLIAPENLLKIDQITNLGVVKYRKQFENERRQRIQRENVYSFFDNEIEMLTGDIENLLMDCSMQSRQILIKCLSKLRQLRILTANYAQVCAPRAELMHNRVVKTISDWSTYHPIPQNVILQILRKAL